jgi:hypothetical protein
MAKYSLNLDEFMDANPGASYQEVIDLMLKYQQELAEIDAKARNAVNGKAKLKVEEANKKRKEKREEIIIDMEQNLFLVKILDTVKTFSKAVKSIAKMIIYIITALFSVEGVKEALKFETLSIMEQIYDKSMKIYKFI